MAIFEREFKRRTAATAALAMATTAAEMSGGREMALTLRPPITGDRTSAADARRFDARRQCNVIAGNLSPLSGSGNEVANVLTTTNETFASTANH